MWLPQITVVDGIAPTLEPHSTTRRVGIGTYEFVTMGLRIRLNYETLVLDGILLFISGHANVLGSENTIVSHSVLLATHSQASSV